MVYRPPTIIRAIDQITVTDITDNYFIELSKDSYVFTGDSPSGASSGSCSVTVKVYKGGEELKKKKVSTDPYPALSSIATSFSDTVINVTQVNNTGIWSGDTWVPYQFTVSINNNQTLSVAKEIPFTATIDFSDDNSDDVTLTKTFMVTTTKTGDDGTSVTVSSTHIYYGYCTSGTDYTQVPSSGTGAWQENTVPTVPLGQYLWTKTVVTYSTGTSTTSYSVSYTAQNGTSQYLFIRYAPTGDTSQDDMTTTPQTGTKYIGVAVVTTNSAPSTKSSYTWSEYVGESGEDGFSIWTTTATPSSSQFDYDDLVGPDGLTPRVGEVIIQSNRYQYTITSINDTTEKATVGSPVDLKGTNGTSVEWKGDLASAPSNPEVLWAYYNTTDKKSYIYNGSSWDTMTNDGSDATQYYYHVVYCNNTSTGAGYSTTASNQLYTGTYIDTNAADAATWASLPSGVKWNYTKGEPGDDGISTAHVYLYKRTNSAPSKPYNSYSGTITYTFATNTFDPLPSSSSGGEWSTAVPATDGTPLYVSTITLTGSGATATVDKTKFTTPTIMAEDGKAVAISANPQTFTSSDGGNTYSPDSVVLTPRFQNTTYRKWYYINSGGTEVDLTSSPPTGVSINSTTKALTITKAAVSDLSSGSAVFKNYKSIVFKCEVNEKDANNNYIYDTFTVVKLKDGKAIASVEIKYGMSASSTTAPSTWYDSISSITTWTPGYFLWERYKYTYSDGTTEPSGANDYIYVKSMQGQTGVGIESITPLHYLRVIVEGYKSGSTFYEDSAHTKAIIPVDNCYYLDKGVTPNKYWQYVTSAYVDKGTTAPPDPPSAPHQASTGAQADDISNNTKPNQWTTNTPRYISGGTYYISEEVAYDDNTYQYSAVVPDNIVTDAYMDIDRNTGQINIISEQVLNLEQTDENRGATVTFSKDCYVGSLHRLTIAPTANTGPGSIHSLYPRTDLYPSTTLYPREALLIVQSTDSRYGTKYQYHIDIDDLNWTDVNIYDEFVYEDGKCWIIRREQGSGSIIETIEPRKALTPVNPVIDIGMGGDSEEIQVSNSVIWIPTKDGITLKLIGVNDSDPSTFDFLYKATYLIDNVYTSNFTSSLDLISQINMSPGNIKIKANNIALEGYTTINDGFKIDLQGNMECNDATINGSLVTKDGVLTSITYTGSYWTCWYPFISPKKYELDMGNTLPLVGMLTESDGTNYTFFYKFLNFNVLIPDNFIPVAIRVIAHSTPAQIGYSNSNLVSLTPGNIKVYLTDNLAESNTLWIGSSADIEGCVPVFHPLDIPAHTFATGANDDWIFEGDAENVFDGPGLYNITLKTDTALPSNTTSAKTARDRVAACSGIIDAVCQIIGYMDISVNTEGGE